MRVNFISVEGGRQRVRAVYRRYPQCAPTGELLDFLFATAAGSVLERCPKYHTYTILYL
jgi:hypothetical protein